MIVVLVSPGRQKKWSVKLLIFSCPSILTFVMGAQKNPLVETIMLSTHNACFA